MNFTSRFLVGPKMIRILYSSRVSLSYSCWSCGKTTEQLVSDLFCPHCRTLQKPDKQKNYFKLMGVEEKFGVDENDLAKKYKELQKYLHPDKFSRKDKNEQAISEEYSALVNEAYITLLQPLSRGIYMLNLKGQELPEDTQIDQDFLMEIMEKNEEVESATTEDDIMRLNSENREVLEDLKKELSKAFFAGDLRTVISILSRMKYYTSIDSQIQASIRRKGIIK